MLRIFELFKSLSRVNVLKVSFYILVTLFLHSLSFKNYILDRKFKNHIMRQNNSQNCLDTDYLKLIAETYFYSL